VVNEHFIFEAVTYSFKSFGYKKWDGGYPENCGAIKLSYHFGRNNIAYLCEKLFLIETSLGG
jgi:hypothetical protein